MEAHFLRFSCGQTKFTVEQPEDEVTAMDILVKTSVVKHFEIEPCIKDERPGKWLRA